MLKRIILGCFTCFLAFNAQAIEFKGSLEVNVPTNQQQAIRIHKSMASENSSPIDTQFAKHFKKVYLMKANLSTREKQAIGGFNPFLVKALATPSTDLPSRSKNLMDNMPVLDQGMHGSCVTFATTAAMDSMINKGDYISQLCSLALGSYLEKNTDLPSGWDGSYGPLVLNQLLDNGIISKDKEKQLACGGLVEYPIRLAEETGKAMAPENYHAARDKLDNFYWEPMLTTLQRFLNSFDHDYHPDALVQAVKRTLTTQYKLNREVRVTFGVLLPIAHCYAGACAKYHEENDTWALTDSINYDLLPFFGGHEMVIAGYDDNATVVDNEGKSHTGIFILRNSWGSDVGDKGNYYMTYDFFKKFVTEVQRIWMFKSDDEENKQ